MHTINKNYGGALAPNFGSSVYFVLITEDEIILSVFQTCWAKHTYS